MKEPLAMICKEAPRIKLARDIHLNWASHPELYEKYKGLSSKEWDLDWASFYQKQLDACKAAGFPVPTPPLAIKLNIAPILIAL
ncbi:MAG: hypothetical protein QW622_03355, partial [Candidatus Pacearchaeota archaeon]